MGLGVELLACGCQREWVVKLRGHIPDHRIPLFEHTRPPSLALRAFLLSLIADPFGSRAKKKSDTGLTPVSLALKTLRRAHHHDIDVATRNLFSI
jgi:hypothetical protein